LEGADELFDLTLRAWPEVAAFDEFVIDDVMIGIREGVK
jgi:hypothetical protein